MTHPQALLPPVKTYSLLELEALLDLAEEYNDQTLTAPCRYFYRNKDVYYFQQVERQGGIMEPILKDNSGDPRNPINGRLKGVFFSASNRPPKESVYGTERVNIFANEIMEKDCHLYFSDFCCYRDGGPHYVQLVLVPKNQVAYLKILKRLPELDIEDNPFMTIRSCKVYTTRKSKLWLEIFYTDTVNVRRLLNEGSAFYDQCGATDRQRSKSGRVRKNKNCSVCNIIPGSVPNNKKPRVRPAARNQAIPATIQPSQYSWNQVTPNLYHPSQNTPQPLMKSSLRQPEERSNQNQPVISPIPATPVHTLPRLPSNFGQSPASTLPVRTREPAARPLPQYNIRVSESTPFLNQPQREEQGVMAAFLRKLFCCVCCRTSDNY